MNHQFTHKQHIVAVSIIKRFANAQTGKVSVYCLKNLKDERFITCHPQDKRFVIIDGWDQYTEDIIDNKKTEEPYISLTKYIASKKSLTVKEQKIISDFHSLLKFRSRRKSYTQEWKSPYSLVADQDTCDILERNNYITSLNGIIPKRQQGRVLRHAWELWRMMILEQQPQKECHWVIVKSDKIDFIVSDNFLEKVDIVPISPSYCFVEFKLAKQLFGFSIITDQKIDFWQASLLDTANINKIVIDNAEEYFFSRDLTTSLHMSRL